MKSQLARICFAVGFAFLVQACGGGGGTSSMPNPVTGAPPTGTAVETLRFANTDFDEVEILNSFAFIVQNGDRFAISVDIDSQYSHVFSVTQEGARLQIRFDPSFQGDIHAGVARGIVTLPLLSILETGGSAFVDMAGFEQSYMQIRQSGASHIEGSNSRLDFADIALSGSSHLSLTNAAALPSANVTSTGSSQVTLIVMDGGSLTGSAAGSTNVSYYGSSVSMLVDTYDTASVTWQGQAQGHDESM